MARSRAPRAAALTVATLAAAALAAPAPAVPAVPLFNAAAPGTTMPAIGLGTGAYSSAHVAYGAYPECWGWDAACIADAANATAQWLALGGRRLDNANSYRNVGGVGAGVAASGVPRSEVFYTSKVGPSFPLGYNETLAQFQDIVTQSGLGYVDLLLVHYPWFEKSQGNVTNNVTQSSDPACNSTAPTFNERECRLSTWRAMVSIWASGGARAVGVSNWNITHIEELREAGMVLPAVNQIPINIYRSSSQMDIIAYCARNQIAVQAYSPFGVPDYHPFPAPLPASNQLQHPTVLAVAAKHGLTPAQALLKWLWQLGLSTNPRTMSPAHMADNLAAYAAAPAYLDQADMVALSGLPQVTCDVDPKWYECACSLASGCYYE